MMPPTPPSFSPCLWTTSNNHSSWSVASPQQTEPATPGALPETDHSAGSPDGHFLLLSASPAAEASGSCEHQLTSPVLPASGSLCFLQVAVFESGPAGGNLTSLFFHLRILKRTAVLPGCCRAEWEVLEAAIGQVDQPFQVSLVYTSCVGAGEDSSSAAAAVALDSLELLGCESEDQYTQLSAPCGDSFHCEHSGGCIHPSQVCNFHTDCPLGEDEGLVCDALPFGSYCSFDRDSCGWSVSRRLSGWRRVAGDRLLEQDDMQGVTLQRTPGHILFLRVRGSNSLQEASVSSAAFPRPVSSAACQMRFSLYVYGKFNGSLSVSVEENGTAAAPLVWERKGPWTDDWEAVALQLTGLRFQLKVTAVWAPGSTADVALDDVAVGAACFSTDLNSLLPVTDFEDFLSPLPEPSASEVSLMTWWFNSCGASGPQGPTQAQCDSTYRNTNVSVTVAKEGSLRGVQMWRVPATNRYLISAYGAAGGKGAKNHNKRNHGVFISAIFPLEKGETLYILVGHQGEDACPGRNPHTQKICLGESSVIEDNLRTEAGAEWAGGGGGGGGATYVFKMEGGDLVPLLIAAGGGGNSYMEDPESSLDQIPLEQFENSTNAPSTSGRTGAAGGGGGWRGVPSTAPGAGKSLEDGAEGGSSCPLAVSRLGWSTFGGFGGGGGACTAGGGGGGYRGGDAAPTDELTADGQNGISFMHPMGEIFLQPLAAMESHGECDIKVQLNCSHCQSQSCRREEDSHLVLCLCDEDQVLAGDNVTCVGVVTRPPVSPAPPQGPAPQGQMSTSLILAVVISTTLSGVALVCAGVLLMWYRRKNELHAVRGRLQSPEYKLSKIRSSTIMTDYNPNYCFAGKAASLSELKEVPRRNITLLRALGHGAFGEVYEGQVLGMSGDGGPMQVAIKTLPEICSEQDEMDFLMEALIMRCGEPLLELFSSLKNKNIVFSLPVFHNHPAAGENVHFSCRDPPEAELPVFRDIAARNCLLTCPGPDRVAKIGDFGMARDIYRASYYRKGGRAMLPVKWMPPEAFMEGIFTCKTDTWSFGVLLWEILSLGYMPYPCKTNQEVLEFVTSGGRMDPPKSCPGPVYRIMTQCWQHCPEHRPNFSTILERINYCTQDPDVINTPLPVEYGPSSEEDGGTVIRPTGPSSTGLAPASQLGPGPPCLPPQPARPLLQRTQPVHQQVASCREAPEPSWAEAVPAAARLHPEPPQHRPCSRNSSSSGSQRLKNKTKNLWNPTYGSWVLENFKGKKTLAHTQSVPLSGPQTCDPAAEKPEAGCDGAGATYLNPPGSSTSSAPAASCQAQAAQSASCQKTAAGGGTKAGIDLAKLQSFPCGNVNYAYDEQSYEAESLPLVVPRAPEAASSSSSALSLSSGTGLGLALGLSSASCVPKLLLKRHASYGHEDVRRHTKADKPTRDRDSGFSLSEDLSVTPI
uniref:receptor protein-tyrosine kinase n=1 Tax=Salarias fasciatus TaxID=181472 RepID=A0A672IBI1_SALFA